MAVVKASEGNVVQTRINSLKSKYGSAIPSYSNNAVTARTTKLTAGQVNTWVDRMAAIANAVRSHSNVNTGLIARPGRIAKTAKVQKKIIDDLVHTGDVALTYCNYRECHTSECHRSECNRSECNTSECSSPQCDRGERH